MERKGVTDCKKYFFACASMPVIYVVVQREIFAEIGKLILVGYDKTRVLARAYYFPLFDYKHRH